LDTLQIVKEILVMQEHILNRYPINDKVPGTGVGTITFDQIRDIARYSPLTPYKGKRSHLI
jgi:hypothetical protein